MVKVGQRRYAEPRIAGFVCNWGAYSGVEMAGVNRRQYPASVKLVKVMCLGRLHPGLLLKAFEAGADGVVLLGCPPQDCHYQCAAAETEGVFRQTRSLLGLLGIAPERLSLIRIPVGRDDILVKQVAAFVRRINKAGASPLGVSDQGAKTV